MQEAEKKNEEAGIRRGVGGSKALMHHGVKKKGHSLLAEDIFREFHTDLGARPHRVRT